MKEFEPGKPKEGQKEKIAEIRKKIAKYEAMDDEAEVLELEAELRALEKGEEFDREDFLAKKKASKISLRDLHSTDLSSIDEIKEFNADLIETAEEQLYEIGPSLRDLAQRIMEEKPDMVVFLDKGARVLATPMSRFLSGKVDPMPEIKFYNDDALKASYLRYQDADGVPLSFYKVVEEDFSPYKGKKVFFIDETFSFGKGAAALSSAIEDSEVDGYYFAITKDPSPRESEEEWNEEITRRANYSQLQADLNRLKKSGKLKVYENSIGYLFTKLVAPLYVTDKSHGQTGPRYEIIPEDEVDAEYDYSLKPGEIPHYRRYVEDNGKQRNWKEYDKQVRLANRKTVQEIQQMIFETLADK